MKKIIVFHLLLLTLAFGSHALAVCPDPDTVTTVPKLTDVKVKSRIAFDSATKIYAYSYDVKNGTSSTGCIWHFKIDIKKPAGGIMLSSDGLNNSKNFAHLDYSSQSPQIVPITFPSLPQMSNDIIWAAGLNPDGLATWGSIRYIYEIAPGETLSGFEMTSYGLPGIRDYSLQPEYVAEEEDLTNMGVSEEEYITNTFKHLEVFYDSILWKGRTIGPTAPPADFKPVEFLDYIVSLKKDAYYQGWIIQKNEGRDCDKDRDRDKDKDKKNKNDGKENKCKDDDKETGIMNSLDKKLAHARAELIRGDNREAIEKLKSFMHEVAALYKEGKEIRHSHITSEAFALLYYNAEYLIGQLDGDKKGHHHKHHNHKYDKDRRD